MDKLEQIKETIEESAGLLDEQREYNFQLDEIIRILSENGHDRIKSVRLNEGWLDTTYFNPRLYNNGWILETDVGHYWDEQYRTSISAARPFWMTNTPIYTTTSGSDAVVSTYARHPEEWCDFVTDDAIPF